jgi:chemotaxis protein methyltransferase CheR
MTIRLTEREFELFQVLIHQQAGIFIPTTRKHQLERKLARRVKELNLTSYEQYFQRVAGNVEQELVTMLDSLAAKETRFFRDFDQFRFLERHVLRGWDEAARSGERPRTVRAWSAGCSTGEEAYSLAMILLDRFPVSSGWRVEVIASDLSYASLEIARRAEWPQAVMNDIPVRFGRFLREQGKMIQATEELRSAVRFERLNLNEMNYPMAGGFDVILCRNVLIYFDGECRRRIVSRLLHHLAADGYLMLGHAESIAKVGRGMREVSPGIFTFNDYATNRQVDAAMTALALA